MKTCPACNHQNPDDTRICKSCGNRLEFSAGSGKTRIRDADREAFAAGYLVADRYEIVSELGIGGMGVVYRVRDTRLQSREMALKMIHPELTELPEAQQRFEQEVNTCLDLLHPNIVRVHNLEEWQGQQFFTMEYITGRSLQAVIAERKSQRPPFTLSEAASVFTPLLDALAYAHQYTIHRDIKPDNIIVLGDFPDVSIKVLDFGIAKTLSVSSFTQTAQVLGTAYYMAPEQMRGAQIDHRADLYSAGMILNEMLTGEMAVGRFRLPGEIYTGIPKELDEMLEKALATNPEQRFADAAAMQQALQRALAVSGAEIKIKPVIERSGAAVAESKPQAIQEVMGDPKPVPERTRRTFPPWMYASAIGLIVFLAAGVFFLNRDRKDSVTSVEPAQKAQIMSKTAGGKEPAGKKTIESESVTQKPPIQQAQSQKKVPALTSEAYIFCPNEKRVKNMKIVAVTSWQGAAADLIKGFQAKGIRIAKMPETEAARALEVGIVDGVLTTSKDLIAKLKKRHPEGVVLGEHP